MIHFDSSNRLVKARIYTHVFDSNSISQRCNELDATTSRSVLYCYIDERHTGRFDQILGVKLDRAWSASQISPRSVVTH